jgi:hypothetical protein
MARSIEQIASRVETLRQASSDRDQRRNNVHDVRSGKIETVMPGAMPDAWPHPIVANLIDTSARDTAEVMGAMPSINCATGTGVTDKAKKFSSKKTKVANSYVQSSGLTAGRQIVAADFYSTYAEVLYIIEPDFKNKRPYIRVENPMGTYTEKNMFGEITSFSKVWVEEAIHLVSKFPHLQQVLMKSESSRGPGSGMAGMARRKIELVKYCDAETIVIYLPAHGNQIVSVMPNPLGKVYVAQGIRPGYDNEERGAYDDAIWVQLAKARMALLGLEATEKTVRAPMAVPRDVQKMTFGDDAIIRTDSPEKIRRVGVDVPSAAFQEGAMLEQELRVGTRTPEARSGNVDASVITGRGVQALMGGFNTVVSTGQTVLAEALRTAIELCFEMDEKLWPKVKKTVRGTVQGTPFEEDYVPGKDIDGNHTVDVTYGFAAGQDPARAIVGLLQLRGDQLISRDFFQRQLPMSIDVVAMQQQIDNEQMVDALKQGMMGYAQAIPQMALQGQDPIAALKRMADLIKLREKGKSVQDAVLEVFQPDSKAQAAPQNPLEAMLAQGGAAPEEGATGGLPGASEAPQGMDLQSMLAGLTSSGEATMSARTQRQSAI